MIPDEFHYRLARRARGLRPGQHRGSQQGDGLETVAHVDLLQGRDPRRLDLRASARDPMRRLLLRSARQRVSVPVYLLADLSASMGSAGRVSKLEVLADFTAALALSAYRSGDAFAFFGCDERLRPEFLHPPGRSRGAGLDIAHRLRAFDPDGRSADGLLQAAALIVRRDALVFLVSDFHMAPERVQAVLEALARFQVVPVVLANSRETDDVSGAGIARVRDAETGRERTIVLTRASRERLRQQGVRHRQHLDAVFRRHGTAGLWLGDSFDADRVTRHFHA